MPEKSEILISNFQSSPETKKDGILIRIEEHDFGMRGKVSHFHSRGGLRVEVENLPVQICLELNPSLLPETMSDFALFFSYESRDIGTFNLIFQDFGENGNYEEVGREVIEKANLGTKKKIQILNLPTRFVRIVFEPPSLGTFFITNMRLVKQKKEEKIPCRWLKTLLIILFICLGTSGISVIAVIISGNTVIFSIFSNNTLNQSDIKTHSGESKKGIKQGEKNKEATNKVLTPTLVKVGDWHRLYQSSKTFKLEAKKDEDREYSFFTEQPVNNLYLILVSREGFPEKYDKFQRLFKLAAGPGTLFEKLKSKEDVISVPTRRLSLTTKNVESLMCEINNDYFNYKKVEHENVNGKKPITIPLNLTLRRDEACFIQFILPPQEGSIVITIYFD